MIQSCCCCLLACCSTRINDDGTCVCGVVSRYLNCWIAGPHTLPLPSGLSALSDSLTPVTSPRELFPHSQQATEPADHLKKFEPCLVLPLSVHTDSQERQVHARTNHSCAESFVITLRRRAKGWGTGKQQAVNHCNSFFGSSASHAFRVTNDGICVGNLSVPPT
ncbi:hypothetical protein BDP81DRAFT_412911, partial [Colletotrichum phormii]